MAPASDPAADRSSRWKTFADVVAFALGTNVWVSLVILPAAYVGAIGSPLRFAAALLPFAVLVLGLLRRSEMVLLGVFPAALLVPIGFSPAMAQSQVYGPIRLSLVAVGVVAYLFGVSFFSTFHEPPAPRSIRGLSSAQQGPAARWMRRERVYRMLVVMSVLIPVALVAWVNYDGAIADYIGEMYAGRVELMTTALAVGAVVLWLGIFHFVIMGVLRPHRTGDRDLVTTLAAMRADAKSGRPRPRFYIAVAIALGAMGALVLAKNLKG